MFYAELNAYLTRELAEDGYSGVEVRVTPTKTEIIVKATKYASLHTTPRPLRSAVDTCRAAWSGGELQRARGLDVRSMRLHARPFNRTKSVLGEKGRRIRELTAVVQQRFKFPEDSVELFAERVTNRALSAIAQAESLRYKLLGGLAVRR